MGKKKHCCSHDDGYNDPSFSNSVSSTGFFIKDL